MCQICFFSEKSHFLLGSEGSKGQRQKLMSPTPPIPHPLHKTARPKEINVPYSSVDRGAMHWLRICSWVSSAYTALKASKHKGEWNNYRLVYL